MTTTSTATLDRDFRRKTVIRYHSRGLALIIASVLHRTSQEQALVRPLSNVYCAPDELPESCGPLLRLNRALDSPCTSLYPLSPGHVLPACFLLQKPNTLPSEVLLPLRTSRLLQCRPLFRLLTLLLAFPFDKLGDEWEGELFARYEFEIVKECYAGSRIKYCQVGRQSEWTLLMIAGQTHRSRRRRTVSRGCMATGWSRRRR